MSILTVSKVVLKLFSRIEVRNIARQYCIILCNNAEGLFFNTAQHHMYVDQCLAPTKTKVGATA